MLSIQVAQIVLTSHHRQRAMSIKLNPGTSQTQPVIYQIRIKGHLGPEWREWFGFLTITLEENGDTLLTGAVTDQSALHGLIRKVRDLGMPLISVIPAKAGHVDASDVKPCI